MSYALSERIGVGAESVFSACRTSKRKQQLSSECFVKKEAELFDSMFTSRSTSNNDTSDALVNTSKGASFNEPLR